MAGGNGILSVLGSPGLDMSAGMAPPVPAAAAPVNGVVNTSSTSVASLTHVQIGVAAMLLLSLAVLVGLNKAGFRFAVTVG